MDVYDILEERGLILKGPGQGARIHLRPRDAVGGGAGAPELLTINARGAGYGDPATNARVEQAAMEAAMATYQARGWLVSDVSRQNLGWDITAQRGGDELHLEVKGVSGSKPRFALTRNEYGKADTDWAWRLALVTKALTDPSLAEYDARTVLEASEPYVYRVTLA